MGLDILNFLFRVEDTFGLTIPDEDAQHLTTPGRLIDYLYERLPARPAGAWTRDQVAEIVHGLIAEQLGIRRSDYTEDSRWVQDMGIS